MKRDLRSTSQALLNQQATATAAADEPVAVSLARCGIAETGSVVIHSGPDTPVLLAFLPLHHIVALPAGAILPEGARFVFRPQDARLVAATAPAPPGAIRLAGAIRQREFLGATMRYAVALGENTVLVDVPHQAGTVPATMGDAILLDIDARSGLFLAV